MAFLKNKAIILAKRETVYGTDPLPVPATDAILVSDPAVEYLTQKIERNNVKPNFGAKETQVIGEGMKVTFSTELRGSNATPPDTPPEIAPLLRACGLVETIDSTPGSEKVEYAPETDIDSDSVAIYFHQDGILHKMLGARGSVSLELKTNALGSLKWEFQGLYAGPAAIALPASPGFSTHPAPVFRAASFEIDGFAAAVESIKIDLKNELAKRVDANAATGILSWYIKERQVTGSINPEVAPLTTKDFRGLMMASTKCAFTATVGNAAGNKVVITAPAVQIDDAKDSDRDNILVQDLSLRFVPTSAGNDEIKLTFR